jgi:hypothetical protein
MRRFAAFAAVIAALLAVGSPVASARPASIPQWETFIAPTEAIVPATDPGVGSPHCPVGYDGPTNLATGCPFWLMVN